LLTDISDVFFLLIIFITGVVLFENGFIEIVFDLLDLSDEFEFESTILKFELKQINEYVND